MWFTLTREFAARRDMAGRIRFGQMTVYSLIFSYEMYARFVLLSRSVNPGAILDHRNGRII